MEIPDTAAAAQQITAAEEGRTQCPGSILDGPAFAISILVESTVDSSQLTERVIDVNDLSAVNC